MGSPDVREFLEARSWLPLDWSADDGRVLVQSNLTGSMQLYEVPASGGEPVQLTHESEPVGGRYVPSRQKVFVTRDAGGNERHQLYLLGDDGGLEPLVED